MATSKSVNITNIEADPTVTLIDKKSRKKTVIDKVLLNTVTLAAADVVLIGQVPSNAVITKVKVRNDDLDVNGTPALVGEWGLYYSGIGGSQFVDGNLSGTVIDADIFASTSDTTLQALNVAGVDFRFTSASMANFDQEAWELGGLTADPGGMFYIGYLVDTIAATGVAAGNVLLEVQYM